MFTRAKIATAMGLLGVLATAATAEAAVNFTTTPVPVSGKTLDVAVGDVDGTTGPDLVAAVNDNGIGKLAVRLNTGNGTFAPETLFPLGCVAYQVELTDLGGTNGDNTPDGALDAAIFCNDNNNGRVGRIAGDGTGAFPGPAILPGALVSGTGDGLGIEGGFQRMELGQIRPAGSPLAPFWTYYYNACGIGSPCYISTICMTYDWQTLTCFEPVKGYPNIFPPLQNGTVADARIFGTGRPEGQGYSETRRLVAFGNFPGAGAPPGTQIDGTERDFGPSPGTQIPAWKSIAIGDLAGDGPDILTAEGVCGCIGSPADPAAGRVSVLPGNTAQGVDPNVVPVTTQSVPGVLSIEVGDIDLDGRQDVIGTSHTNDGNEVFVQLGDGAGGLAAPVTVPLPPTPSYSRAPITLADFDRNGSSDAVVITDDILVLTNGSTPVVPPVPVNPVNPLKPLAGITGLKGSAMVDKRGVVSLGTAKNPPTAGVAISIRIPGKKGRGRAADPLRAKTTVIGRARVTVPAGGEKALEVRLKSKGKKKLKSGALKTTVTLVATATDGTEDTRTQALRIKPAKKKKRK